MGYLMIDHREGWSGLPAEERARLGEKVVEYDTVTCPHCNHIMKIIKGQTSGYWCGNCWGPICEGCAATYYTRTCLSMKERIDRELARAQFLLSV